MRPCPFCNSNDLEEIFVVNNYMIKCNNCLACGPVCFSSEHALQKWEDREDFEKDLAQAEIYIMELEDDLVKANNKIEDLEDRIDELEDELIDKGNKS